MADSLTDISRERRKAKLIDQLLDRGIYKCKNQQLYELTLTELEKTFRQLSCAN